MDEYFKDKVCLLVGGTRGIGFELARKIYKTGVVLIIGGRDLKTARDAAMAIDESGKKVVGVKIDVNSEVSVNLVLRKLFQKFKKIDFIINTAGVFEPFGPFEKVKFLNHEKVINVNLLGAMRVCYAVLPYMKKNNFGRIILFSGGGIGGNNPLTNASSYYTSKGAIAIFTEVLGKELENSGVTINAILPGQILTDSTRSTFKLTDEQLGPELAKATRKLEKTGGNSVLPVLELVSFLLREDSNHITGRLLSAKWDNISNLSKSLPDGKYKLRRIEGKMYRKAK
ncbi:MAG: dehydrogenase [uncultured bacterium]|uniref:(S)-1-phenylethanol dehydrogenase Ped n=3 Tax=Candidatus Daviesiibacteriota TaxID=1752718 RepID=A0A0G0HE19_9BACT|nr:MAG: dehydrogenase [uncultured bacterium]KKQ10359.1 MAG: (S)-1-phenylethanol dehydrogenase Ped [Candidatus Daviesbacteria bacterium GW2011_GWB1_36_5]KKQ15522.1 MAG: (S)-1-phenylethanol dehydrogenase Ped [Candidatus Daviesbacteria bacterium GW2011_GWA1_36_8]OGE17812.1 MAG: hypothetical protein A2858_03650 [Candidatus Daviesbacteria bacterium RIFCSPHIGHO2_01_FULL_36_37]